MRRAALLAPTWDEPWLRLGQSFRGEGLVDVACESYDSALLRNPRRIESLLARAVLSLQRNEPNEAVGLLLRATEISRDNDQVWHALAFGFVAIGVRGAALAAITRAGELAPENFTYALAHADLMEAIPEDDVDLPPPGWSDAVELGLAGRAAMRRGVPEEAAACLEAATELEPNDPELLKMLGSAQLAAHAPEKAEPTLRAALKLAPDDPAIINDLAVALGRLYRFGEAAEVMNAPSVTHSSPASMLFNRATLRAAMGDLAGSHDDIEAARGNADLRSTLHTECTLLPYRSGTTAATLRESMVQLAATLPRGEIPAMRLLTPDPDRKLRVGLLSNSLRQHPVGWLTLAGLEALDPSLFSLDCFGHFMSGDPFAANFVHHVRAWHPIAGLNERGVAEVIAAQEIDILIDLGGFGDTGQIAVLAHRPAPVQMKWVGTQASTTGMAEMDWFITDRWETPEGFDAFYTERLLRLADGYVCYRPPTQAASVNLLPATTNGHVTFGCFNNLVKLTDETLGLWQKLLERVPRSQLILRCPQFSETNIPERFLERAAALGVDTTRLELKGRAPHPVFIAGYREIDIALDPFPYSGGLTTCEALFMGVPVITLAGDFFAARHSASHLSNAGLADCVTETPPAYIERAVAMASDVRALATLRARLRQQVLGSPLCDGPRFGRNLGAALRFAWQDYCRRAKSTRA